MQEKTTEQYQAEVNRLQKVIQHMASSKSGDAIFIAELKAIVDEKEEIIQQQQELNNAVLALNENLTEENKSLKSYLEQATAPVEKEGEADEVTTDQ